MPNPNNFVKQELNINAECVINLVMLEPVYPVAGSR